MCLTWATVPTVGAGVLLGRARLSRRAREACGCVPGPARGSPGARGGDPQPWAGSLSTPSLSPAFWKEQGALGGHSLGAKAEGGHARGPETPAWNREVVFPGLLGPSQRGRAGTRLALHTSLGEGAGPSSLACRPGPGCQLPPGVGQGTGSWPLGLRAGWAQCARVRGVPKGSQEGGLRALPVHVHGGSFAHPPVPGGMGVSYWPLPPSPAGH